MIYPSHQELLRILSYSPDTGAFTWLTKPNRNIVIGSRAGWFGPDGYERIGINGKKLVAHRLAWLYMTGELPDETIDHINRKPGDNRWANLRLADLYEQAHNQGIRKSNTTGRKGVYASSGKFFASIRSRGSEPMHLGSFETLNEAAHAYNKAAVRLHGEFARLNPVGAQT